MPDQPRPKTRQYWVRLTVRGLIVLALITGAGLGWIARNARIQRDAVAAIKSAGGWCWYDWETGVGENNDDGIWMPLSKPDWQEWLEAWIGEGYFGDVAWVTLYNNQEESMSESRKRGLDATLANMGCFSRLEKLELVGTQADDEALANFKRLSHLKELTLTRTRLTEVGFLQTMNRLEELSLMDSPVVDAGLANLKGLTHLRFLCLTNTRVTDSGLVYLKGLTYLRELYLEETQVTDAGLEHLKGLTNLRELYLRKTRVTDSGVRELQRVLPRLTIYLHP